MLGLLLATTATSAAEQFYRWTDEQGVTHYSADPPPKTANNASEVNVRTRLPSGSKNAVENLQKQRDDSSKAAKSDKDSRAAASPAATAAPKAAGKPPEKYAEKCKQLQVNLQTMQEHARVKVTDAKGENRVLSPEEKDSQQEDIQREIQAFCQ